MSYTKAHDECQKEVFCSYDVIQIQSFLGMLWIEQCDRCGYWHVACTHTVCEWNAGGHILICNLCGTDCT